MQRLQRRLPHQDLPLCLNRVLGYLWTLSKRRKVHWIRCCMPYKNFQSIDHCVLRRDWTLPKLRQMLWYGRYLSN